MLARKAGQMTKARKRLLGVYARVGGNDRQCLFLAKLAAWFVGLNSRPAGANSVAELVAIVPPRTGPCLRTPRPRGVMPALSPAGGRCLALRSSS